MTEQQAGAAPQRQVSVRIFIAGIVVAVCAGVALGVYRHQLLGYMAPLFGQKAVTGDLDTASLQATYRELAKRFDGKLDQQALVDGANKGMVAAAGDAHTVYMTQKEAEQFDADLSGSIGGGIGVVLAVRAEQLTAVKVLAGTPAEQAGIKPGDGITAVNGEATKGLDTEAAVAKIRGDIGTTVRLTIDRDGAENTVTVTRAQITAPSVESTVKDGVGVITVSRFDTDTGSQVRRAAESFKSQGVRGVVLDLRGNGGGYVTAAQQVASVWLNDKLVVTERTGDKTIDELRSSKNPVLEGVPTVVLVDGGSASASEIVAGALKDYGVATLVGEKTYGKGTVQEIVHLDDGAQLKVTVARWYTPQGQNISKEGIHPQKEVAISRDDVQNGRDPQLDAALAALKR